MEVLHLPNNPDSRAWPLSQYKEVQLILSALRQLESKVREQEAIIQQLQAQLNGG